MDLTQEEVNMGVREVLYTPLRRAVLYNILGLDTLLNSPHGVTIEELWQERGARGVRADVIKQLRRAAPEEFSRMIEEGLSG